MDNKGGNTRHGIGMRVWRIGVGMRGIWVEMQKNVGNQHGDAGNQGGNLRTAVAITWNSTGNDN